MQSPPFPCYLVPPSSKYSPQHHVLKHPQLPFLPQCQQYKSFSSSLCNLLHLPFTSSLLGETSFINMCKRRWALHDDQINFLSTFLSFGREVGGGRRPLSGPGPPHLQSFYIIHNDAPQSVGLLWTSDQLVAQTSTWQHTTLITDRHPCQRWDSNPQSQQTSGRRPTS